MPMRLGRLQRQSRRAFGASAVPEVSTSRPTRAPKSKSAQPPSSADGRITGRMRTCGFDLLQNDRRGVPYGPYCH
jgi:hypothetical protein